MNDFVFEGHPTRAIFGEGARQKLAEELRRLGSSRPMFIGSARHAEELRRSGLSPAIWFEEVIMHVPADLAARARAQAVEASADALLALGGGSTIGLAKAVALETGLPIVAVPTTYSGSEMTSVWGRTAEGRKTTGRDARVRPKTAIYDPELLLSLPREMAGQSGLNALAHAMEALYAPALDPLTMLFAEESVARLAGNLAAATAAAGPARGAVSEVLYGAWLAGMCLDRAAMGLHHKLCHTLGGSFGLPHAGVHAVLLPYVAAFNLPAAEEARRAMERALRNADAPAALFALARQVGAPESLAALGMKEADLDEAARLATSAPYANPRPVDQGAIRALLGEAFAGRPAGF